MRAIAIIAGGVFRDSIRDRIALRPGILRDAADGLVVPAGAAHRRSRRQDHQGPRAGVGVGDRPVHRHVLRHRPGDERGGAAEHLQPDLEAGHPHPVRRRQVSRARDHAAGQPHRHGDGLLRSALLSRLDDGGIGEGGVGSAGDGSAHAPGVRADRRRVDADHGHRAVLLDVLEPVPLGRPDLRGVRHRALR